MSTQGLVSVTCAGEVVMKLVVGCNGYQADDVAQAIRLSGERPRSVTGALALMRVHGFGCDACRVVLTRDDDNLKRDHEDITLNPAARARFRDTFDDPRFNPRWEHGTADYVEIVAFSPGAQFGDD